MEEKLKRIEIIKIENFIYIICIILIGLSFIGNKYEENYFRYNNEKDKNTYKNILTFVFTVAFLIYCFYFYDSYNSYLDSLKKNDKKNSDLALGNLVASLLIVVAGAIFLYLVIVDNNLETEISFT